MTVNLEKRSLSSCCAAKESKIDLTWLKQHPGQLFNTPELVQERKDMLDDIPVASCDHVCWTPERSGMTSRRLTKQSDQLTHTNIDADPEILHLILGSDCNLTCSYCCKHYSTAWLRDIDQNGSYLNTERDTVNNNDRIILKLGQNAIKQSALYQTVLDEVSHYKNIREIQLTGGEPFLYNGLDKLVNQLPEKIDIFTGLGVDTRRLDRVLSTLPQERLLLTISIENINELYEFNRYGNSYQRFIQNLNIIKDMGIPYRFLSVLSNVTLFGFKDFLNAFEGQDIITNLCVEPTHLSPNVLDDRSKEYINNTDYGQFNEQIKGAVNQPVTEADKQTFVTYINEFVKRRELNLEIFPEAFVNWVNTTT